MYRNQTALYFFSNIAWAVDLPKVMLFMVITQLKCTLKWLQQYSNCQISISLPSTMETFSSVQVSRRATDQSRHKCMFTFLCQQSLGKHSIIKPLWFHTPPRDSMRSVARLCRAELGKKGPGLKAYYWKLTAGGARVSVRNQQRDQLEASTPAVCPAVTRTGQIALTSFLLKY